MSIIVSKITHGATYEEVLKDYPDLERDDIQQAMDFAARLSRKGDALVDELLATNPPLQALVAKSKAGRRRPFRLEDNKN